LISISGFLSDMRQAKGAGIDVALVGIDSGKIMKWIRRAVMKSRLGVEYLLKGVNIVEGVGGLKDASIVEVITPEGKVHIKTKYIVIATGTDPKPLPGIRLDGINILSNRDFFKLKALPESLAIVGAGTVGSELASALTQLGIKIHLIELTNRVLPSLDPEVSAIVQKYLTKNGVRLHLGSTIKEIMSSSGSKLKVVIRGTKGIEEVDVDKVLLAAGRKYNVDGLGLDNVGVKLANQGFIKVDDCMRTSVPTIFAVGDVTGPPLLAHKAFRQALIAADTIALGKPRYPLQPIPMVIFTHPEVASVGLSESKAKMLGIEYEVFKYPFSAVPREFTKLSRVPEGFVKVLVKKKDRRILGAEIVGDGASELIHILSLAIGNGLKPYELLNTVYAHPTISEVVGEIAHLMLGESVHAKSERKIS